MPPPMSRMSVSRSALAAGRLPRPAPRGGRGPAAAANAAGRYRRPALRGARGLAAATNAAGRRRTAAILTGAELRLGDVAGLAGEDREVEHGRSFRGDVRWT